MERFYRCLPYLAGALLVMGACFMPGTWDNKGQTPTLSGVSFGVRVGPRPYYGDRWHRGYPGNYYYYRGYPNGYYYYNDGYYPYGPRPYYRHHHHRPGGYYYYSQ